MIGVGEDNARAKAFEGFLREGFYGGGGAYRHEHRRFDDTMRRGQAAETRTAGIGL